MEYMSVVGPGEGVPGGSFCENLPNVVCACVLPRESSAGFACPRELTG